jgi:hypothetical protein
MNGVYRERPKIRPWTCHSFIVNGEWCIEIHNEDLFKRFYPFYLPIWRYFWDDKKTYARLLDMATNWTKRQDAKIVKAQKMWDAMEAVRGANP